MAAVKSTDTAPEMKVRKAIHRAGFRYRLHVRSLQGTPDLVFPRYRTVVFVHGCFWHWHGCKRSRMPATNRDYWQCKIARNVERDAENRRLLTEQGWTVVVIWECSLTEGITDLVALLEDRKSQAS